MAMFDSNSRTWPYFANANVSAQASQENLRTIPPDRPGLDFPSGFKAAPGGAAAGAASMAALSRARGVRPADLHWELHTGRDGCEIFAGDLE